MSALTSEKKVTIPYLVYRDCIGCFPILSYINFHFQVNSNISVKITIKINPYKNVDVIPCSMCVISIKHILHVLLLNPVEEAKLNNCSTHTLQILQEDRVL